MYELSNYESLSCQAAEMVIDSGREALKDHGYFAIVLTGGHTVQGLYHSLAEISYRSEIKRLWAKTYFFLGDERWVSGEHPDSNGGMVRRLLLEPAKIPDDRVFMIPTGIETPDEAATIYEQTIRDFFAKRSHGRGGELPTFDLILLSMGIDGHVASLFRGTEALAEKERWVTTSSPPRVKPVVERVTITMPVINKANAVMMLIAGGEKRAIARHIMAEPKETGKLYPAAQVRPVGQQIWMVADG
ncbi:MAG: 6-phosphogluconolactonase [Thermodesulfobacteriota bacterium]